MPCYRPFSFVCVHVVDASTQSECTCRQNRMVEFFEYSTDFNETNAVFVVVEYNGHCPV